MVPNSAVTRPFSMPTPSIKTLERLGRELLAEIGLKQPHVCLDQLRGFVRTESPGWRTLGAPWPPKFCLLSGSPSKLKGGVNAP